MATGLLKVITEKCLDCCCGQKKEVKECTASKCPLHPYRHGTNPFRKKRAISEEKRAEIGERLKSARAASADKEPKPKKEKVAKPAKAKPVRKVKEPAKKGTIPKKVVKKAIKTVVAERVAKASKSAVSTAKSPKPTKVAGKAIAKTVAKPAKVKKTKAVKSVIGADLEALYKRTTRGH